MTIIQPLLIEGCETPRPKKSDRSILQLVAAKLAKEVNEWADDEENENTEKHMIEVLEDCFYDLDGYKMAKRLEDDYGYDCDAGLVNILDNADNLVRHHLSEATKKWVTENSIKPKFEVGQPVIVKHKDKDVAGTVGKIMDATAEYVVNCPSLGHRSPGLIGKGIPGTYGIVVCYENVVAGVAEEAKT